MKITPSASKANVQPRLPAKKERWLVAGDSVTGKTYGILRMIDTFWAQVQAGEKEPFTVYWMDTNNSISDYLTEGCTFEHLYYENGGPIRPYPVTSHTEAVDTTGTIMKAAGENDWIVVDLASRIYDFCQDFYALTHHGVGVADLAASREAAGKKGFGAFESSEWNIIKLYHEAALGTIISSFKGNLVLITHVRDLVDQHARREALVLFDSIGLTPTGNQMLWKETSTVLVLWSKMLIPKENNRRVGKGKLSLHCIVVKDRDKTFGQDLQYNGDLYGALQAFRDAGRGKPAIEISTEDDSADTPYFEPGESEEATPEAPAAPTEAPAAPGTRFKAPGR